MTEVELRIRDANRWARRYERWRLSFHRKGYAEWAAWARKLRDQQLTEAATLVMEHGEGQ